MALRKLLLTALFGALCLGCEAKNPLRPGLVTVTQSTSTTTTTTTSTIAPSTTAAFIFSPAAPAALQIVSFNAFGSSAAPGQTIVSYSWDFGDGAKKTGQGVTHDFASEGIYIVTLTVTDSAGATASVSKPIGAGTPVPPVTTTSIPTSTAIRYVAPQADPTIPADLTLFFQQLTSLQRPVSSAWNSLAALAGLGPGGPVATAVGDLRYNVQGTYTTLNGRTGTIQGEFLGQLTPTAIGTFTGTLTANMPGCTATRAYSGPLTSASLQWTGGSLLSNTCSTNPLEFSSLNLVKTDAPPPVPTTTTTTTTPTTTTTTSIIPALSAGVAGATPSGTGLASATSFLFQLTQQASGGVPPYTYSWNFGDGTAAATTAAATHTFANPGTFSVVLTIADSRQVTAQAAPVSITVGSATATWNLQVTSPDRVFGESVAISQQGGTVTATINDTDPDTGGARTASGTGAVSNPRALSATLTYTSGVSPFSVTIQGALDDTLGTWTGTLFGYRECLSSTAPCTFTAPRAVIIGVRSSSGGAGGSSPSLAPEKRNQGTQ